MRVDKEKHKYVFRDAAHKAGLAVFVLFPAGYVVASDEFFDPLPLPIGVKVVKGRLAIGWELRSDQTQVCWDLNENESDLSDVVNSLNAFLFTKTSSHALDPIEARSKESGPPAEAPELRPIDQNQANEQPNMVSQNHESERVESASGVGFLSAIQKMLQGTKAGKVLPWASLLAGIGGAAAIILRFFSDPQTAVFAIITMLVLMAVAVVLLSLATMGGPAVKILALLFGYAAVILIILSAALLMTSFFFDWPRILAPSNRQSADISARFSVDGKTTKSAGFPIFTPITITLEGVPDYAQPFWSQPKLGSLNTTDANTVIYTGCKEGPEAFSAEVYANGKLLRTVQIEFNNDPPPVGVTVKEISKEKAEEYLNKKKR
jgi:hypothetical protein